MLNYKRFTFNYRHSVFYCISKYYLHRTAHLCHDHLSGERTSDRDGEQDAGASLHLHDRDLCTGDQEQDCQGNATPDG